MSPASQPPSPLRRVSSGPAISLSEAFTTGTRTPRPYHRDGETIHQDHYAREREQREVVGDVGKSEEQWLSQPRTRSGQVSPAAGSDSGTEADDERPALVKALPPPHLRPRKGLKVGETNEDAFLTPSQLDDEGRRLSQSYFLYKGSNKRVSEDERRVEEEKLLRRRLAEFARRSSEVGLVSLIMVCVLCGRDVFAAAAQWHHEILAHIIVIATLVLAYPLKLSIVDTRVRKNKLWERFRVPASFDPATVLYPTILPGLVALSVLPGNSATILPNLVLGLSSLPQRLFPRSSRLSGINSLHWLVSILPLIVAKNTMWLQSGQRSSTPYLLKCSPPNGLSPETLVLLYPLHHALLQPLQYLTTTSLLVSELHLLSAALINLLLLASSPQGIILNACLWLGGVSLFVSCSLVLHWNVTLARVPRWKLRRHGHTAEERKSLVDAVSELIDLQRAAAAFSSRAEADDSDADDDHPQVSIKQAPIGRPRVNTVFAGSGHHRGPTSAVEARGTRANCIFPESATAMARPRRKSLPPRDLASITAQQTSQRRGNARPSRLLWCLHLTPDQAVRRKWLYAGYVYLAVLLIVLGPVRLMVGKKALFGHDPFVWALGYLFGQFEPARALIRFCGLETWILLQPEQTVVAARSAQPLLFDIPLLRFAIGMANMRLLLVAYWVAVLIAGLLAVFSLTAYVEVDTRRKVFHGVMVAMLLPATFIDPCFCALALALVLALFLLLEVLRAGHVAPLAAAIGRFVAPYVDGRDLRGPVVVSHIFLLVGCAVPLWFSLAAIPRATPGPAQLWPTWELDKDRRDVAMVAGVICVGLGDAAASLIGRRYGRHKWMWVGGKSFEGSAAFAVAVTAGLLFAKAWLVLGGWRDDTGGGALPTAHAGRQGGLLFVVAWVGSFVKAVFCACGASFMEAVLTGANDNVVVPIALWLLVKGVRL